MSEVLHIPEPDWFTKNPPVQPKREVAEYVEAVGVPGIVVPRRYQDEEEAHHAHKSGVPVLARSEHPDEYAGASDLRSTYEIGARYTDQFIKQRQLYCQLMGIDFDTYEKEGSRSYWEKIPGIAVAIIQDDAVEGRFHMFAKDNQSHFNAGLIVENSVVVFDAGHRQDARLIASLNRIVDAYLAVNELDKFNEIHCPMMEFLLGADDNIYFLQYHRMRDRALGIVALDLKDYDSRDGWLPALFTRGVLKEPAKIDTLLSGEILDGANTFQCSGVKLDSVNRGLIEYLYRRINMDISEADMLAIKSRYQHMTDRHFSRSRMFLPEITVCFEGVPELSLKNIVYPKDMKTLAGQDIILPVDVASDGRQAFACFGQVIISG